MSKKTDLIKTELARIAKSHGGVLHPKRVVDAARSPSSPLHSKFTWDDTVAAEQYRLVQARQLIAITIHVLGETGEKEKVWVSLRPDRERGGGYRPLIAVLSDAALRAQHLQDAMDDMEQFEEKYKHLQELADVFAAMAKTRRRKAA